MEDDVQLALLLKYPRMMRTLEGDAQVYEGWIYVNEEDFKVLIKPLPDKAFKVTLPKELERFQVEFTTVVTELTTRDVITILDCLSSFIKRKIPSLTPTNHCDAYRHVLYEYSDFTNFYLNLKSCCLAHDLSEISVCTLDQAGRKHDVKISVDFDDKDMFSVTSSDLPQDKDLFKKSSSLKEVYDQFLAAVEAFQGFFDVMDTFDGNCWVLDPTQPERRCCHRRIWMRENFSIIFTLDPSDVSKLPEIQFLGPERVVEEHRETLNSNVEQWEPKNGIFPELLKLLGLEHFPLKPIAEERGPHLLMDSGDCSICFSLRLDDQLPDVVCKNKVCEKCYHAECLYEWLVSVNARRFFSEVVGLCPNCEKNISCPIPK